MKCLYASSYFRTTIEHEIKYALYNIANKTLISYYSLIGYTTQVTHTLHQYHLLAPATQSVGSWFYSLELSQ